MTDLEKPLRNTLLMLQAHRHKVAAEYEAAAFRMEQAHKQEVAVLKAEIAELRRKIFALWESSQETE